MKKGIALILTLVLVLGLAACGSAAPAAQNSAPAPEAAPQEAAPAQTSSEPIVIKIATSQLPTQQMGKGIAMLAEKLNEKLGDRVNVMTYDSATLYDSTEEIGACQRNEIQIDFATGGSMETVSEKIQLVKAPYLFPSLDVAYDVLDNSALADEIFAPITDSGLICCGKFSSGNVILANDKRPLKVPADFVGLKMRAPGTMDTMNLTALGATAMTTASDETYSAIQQGVIDGMSTPSSVFVPRKFYEIQHYVTDGENLSMQIGYAIMNAGWFNSLPEDVRALVNEAMEETIAQMRVDIAASTAGVFKKIEEEGCEVYRLTDEERAQWEEATSVVYDQVAASLGQDLVDLARQCVADSAAKLG